MARAALPAYYDPFGRRQIQLPQPVWRLDEVLASGEIPRVSEREDNGERTLIDVVLDFSAAGSGVRLASMATYGLWRFDHQGYDPAVDVPTGSVEGLKHVPVVRCRLVAHVRDAGKPVVLREALYGTHPLFFTQTRSDLVWKSADLIPSALDELEHTGSLPEREVPAPALDASLPPGDGHAAVGSVGRQLALLARHIVRGTTFAGRRMLYRKQWFLFTCRLNRSASVKTGASQSSASLPEALGAMRCERTLMPPPGRFWADPQIVRRNGLSCVFAEECTLDGGRGRIVALTLGEDGRVCHSAVALGRAWHLSYPFIFEHEGRAYMVPESGDIARVDLYECTEFPEKWVFVRSLLTGVHAYDSTIFRHEGRWWLFAAVSPVPWVSPRDHLCVYFTDDPINGQWRPHPRNPVVSDARSARPAGPIIFADGQMLRLGQDSSEEYGRRIRINEIVTLSKTDYREREVAIIDPESHPEAVGVHSVCLSGDLVVADGMRWLPRWGHAK